MDSRLREAHREALVHPDEASARLVYAWQLLRGGFMAAARHELEAARELGADFPPELVERAAFRDPGGVAWSVVEPCAERAEEAFRPVAPPRSDALAPGALVTDGERLVAPALVSLVCRECDEGQVACAFCSEDDPERRYCFWCKGSARAPCRTCEGRMLVLEAARDEGRAACPHSTLTPEGVVQERWEWSWRLERCAPCGTVAVVIAKGLAFSSFERHFACPHCGFFGCRCARGGFQGPATA